MKKGLLLAAGLLATLALLAVGCNGHPKGMESLRWLTDAEKDRVIEIALEVPELAGAKEAYGVYTTEFRWVAIEWLDNGANLTWLDYDYVEAGIPAAISESAEFYSGIIIDFGEPPRDEYRLAINPDTGEVASVEGHGLKTVPAEE